MKHAQLFLLLLLLFISCDNATYDQSQIDEQIETNIKTGKVVTKAFLDLNLRDSIEVVCSKVNKMRRDNKISYSNDWEKDMKIDLLGGSCFNFFYTFKTSKGEVEGHVLLDYIRKEMRLFKVMIFTFESDNKIDAMKELYTIYKSKYQGHEYYKDGYPIFVSITGTRLIEVLLKPSGITITYSDSEYEKVYKNEMEKENLEEVKKNREKVKKTSDDI